MWGRACILSNFAHADSLDEDKSGLVSMEEFCKLFEPTIVRRASSSGVATWHAPAAVALNASCVSGIDWDETTARVCARGSNGNHGH